jgi:LuxR family maltose regulon positive regulatory protein
MMPGLMLYREEPPGCKDLFYLERPRIGNILKIAMQSPAVAVVASQGFGKTSSVHAFLKDYPMLSIWVQLSEDDNDCLRFWENLCSCVAQKNPGLGGGMAKLGFPGTVKLFDVFFNMVDQSIRDTGNKLPPRRYVIVYDDFQVIHDSVMLHLFDRILAFPFPGATVVLISRSEPQVKSLPLVSKGLLTKITAEDLRFTPEETAAYFALHRLTLSPRDLDSFYRDTEGWPQLLSLIAGNADKQGGRLRYSPELVKLPLFKTIEDSFFSSLDSKTRKFLIKLSLTTYWPVELLGEMNDSTRDLESICPFIRYDSYLHAYRIHHLLIEFLKEKQGELSPEERRELYLISAQWCLKNNLRMDAAAYYEKARDYQGLINLYFGYPVLILPEVASFLLAIVERLTGGAEEETGAGGEALLYLRYAIRPRLLTSMDRFEEAAAICREAIAKFEALPPGAINAKILSSVYICLGFVLMFTCRLTKNYKFFPLFKKGYDYSEAHSINPDRNAGQGTIPYYICQVGYPAEAGEFEEYLSNLGPVIALMEKFAGGFMAGMDSLGRCEYYYFKGDLGEAENHARQAVIRARENHQYEVENRALFFLLRIAIHGGVPEEMENLCRQIRTQSETGDFPNRSIICNVEYAWFYAQTGSTSLPGYTFTGDFGEIEGDGIYFPIEIQIKAKCSFAEKHYEEALEILGRWETSRGPQSCLVERLEVTALEAACCLRLGRIPRALEKLEEAWNLGAANGLDMPFIELGEDMRLLASLALENPESPVPREWLETARAKAAAYSKMLAAFEPGNSGAVLRPSETAVLRALSHGLTREEIARKEGLSFYNVRQIIKNLYSKLGAVNRADAVRIAFDKGFLKNIRH